MFGGRKRTCRRGGKTHRKAHRGGRKSRKVAHRSRRHFKGGLPGDNTANLAARLQGNIMTESANQVSNAIGSARGMTDTAATVARQIGNSITDTAMKVQQRG